MAGFEIDNFDRERIRSYLQSSAANSLDDKFPVEDTFCLIGTGSADYPVAGGFSRRLVGQFSDGLVEVGNAYVYGNKSGEPDQTTLAARAYVRRAHSGPYGMVNSEEGFGNLSRFLFGDVRVDCTLLPRRIDLPPALKETAGVRASYSFETFLRVRGESWAMTERLARDGAAVFRRYDEMFPDSPQPDGLTVQQVAAKKWHRDIELFTAFLDTSLRSRPDRQEQVKGQSVAGSIGLALRLRVPVPDYEVDGQLWTADRYEGSCLLDQDLVFLAFEEVSGWQLAWGPNRADCSNSALDIVRDSPDDASAERGSTAFRRLATGSVQFWIPIQNEGVPTFQAWMRVTAQRRDVATTATPVVAVPRLITVK